MCRPHYGFRIAKRVSQAWQATAVALLCILPTGCGYYQYEPLDTPDTEGFVLQPISMTHEVQFLPGQTQIDRDEKERLSAFVEEVDPKDEAEFWVDAGGDRAKRRRTAVVNALEHLGRSAIDEGASVGRPDVVTLTMRRQVALPKSCLGPATWPDPRLLSASCANMLNLMASVEHPNDLIEGRETGLASGVTAAAALRGLLNPTPSSDEGTAPDRAEVTLFSQ